MCATLIEDCVVLSSSDDDRERICLQGIQKSIFGKNKQNFLVEPRRLGPPSLLTVGLIVGLCRFSASMGILDHGAGGRFRRRTLVTHQRDWGIGGNRNGRVMMMLLCAGSFTFVGRLLRTWMMVGI